MASVSVSAYGSGGGGGHGSGGHQRGDPRGHGAHGGGGSYPSAPPAGNPQAALISDLQGKLAQLAGPNARQQYGGAHGGHAPAAGGEGTVEGILQSAIGQIMNLITHAQPSQQGHQGHHGAPSHRYSPY